MTNIIKNRDSWGGDPESLGAAYYPRDQSLFVKYSTEYEKAHVLILSILQYLVLDSLRLTFD